MAKAPATTTPAGKYSYVKTDGSTGYTNDQANAPGIASHSGFQDTSFSAPAPLPPVNSIPADQLGKNAGTYSSYFPPASASSNLAETATASKDAYLSRSAAEADRLSAEQKTGKKSILDVFSTLSGQASKKASLYDSEGVNEDRKAIDELTSQIESRTRAYDKQIDDVKLNNPEGKLASGVNNEVNRISGQKASELADLAIVLNAKTRNYDTAKSIIDQKVDAETEDLKTKLTGLQFFYQENAGNLDDEKRTLLAEKINQADREYQEKKDLRTQIGDLQLSAAKNGAPVSVVRAIGAQQSLEGAMGSAGGYLKSPTDGSGGFYSPDDKRNIAQSGLKDAQAQLTFLHTPAAFQDAFIRNRTGAAYPNASPQDIINSLAEWETYQKTLKDDGSDVDALITKLKAGG